MNDKTPSTLDPVAEAILRVLADTPPAKPVSAEYVAKQISDEHSRKKPGSKPDPNAWRRYFQAVKDQAFHLARQHRIDILRKGKAVAPEDLKGLSGVWRMRLRRPDGTD